jgi:hypothetical protein
LSERKTAIIKDVRVGFAEYSKELSLTCSFDMESSTCTLGFSLEQAVKMMNDANVRENIKSLIGKPCEIEIDDKNQCHFLGMWKK